VKTRRLLFDPRRRYLNKPMMDRCLRRKGLDLARIGKVLGGWFYLENSFVWGTFICWEDSFACTDH